VTLTFNQPEFVPLVILVQCYVATKLKIKSMAFLFQANWRHGTHEQTDEV